MVDPPFLLTITAGPADWTTAGSVAHLRQRDISGSGQSRTSVVVDFGVMRTVGGVGLTTTADFQLLRVTQWLGTGFSPTPIAAAQPSVHTFFSVIDNSTPKFDSSLGGEVIFPSEVRTDRLQIDLIGRGGDAAIGASLLVQLPDPPADLDLRINDGPPVWRSPGVVAAGSPGWSAVADDPVLQQQQVDIAAALSALVGDPAADKSATIDLHIVLTARSPGALTLDLPEASARKIRYVAKVTLASEPLAFASEGALLLPLKIPDYATRVDRISFGMTANLPPERVMPPVGPDAAITADGTTPLAEMLLDPTHGACAALTQTAGFGELVALRFPLRVEEGGAEMQVVLLQAAPDGTPGTPIDGGVTKPVILPASADEIWTTFALPRPLALDTTPIFGLAAVKRGRVRWALTGTAGSGGQVFTGPPKGPWQPLPPLGELAALRGRVRIVAHARRGSPVAPLVLRIDGTSGNGQEATPTAKGVTADLTGPDAGLPVVPGPEHLADLQIISRVAGSVTLSDGVVTVAAAD